jgi:hypothetical protein
VTQRQIWLNLSAWGRVIAPLGIVSWLNTESRAVPGLVEMLWADDMQARAEHSDVPIAQSRPRWTGLHGNVYIFG